MKKFLSIVLFTIVVFCVLSTAGCSNNPAREQLYATYAVTPSATPIKELADELKDAIKEYHDAAMEAFFLAGPESRKRFSDFSPFYADDLAFFFDWNRNIGYALYIIKGDCAIRFSSSNYAWGFTTSKKYVNSFLEKLDDNASIKFFKKAKGPDELIVSIIAMREAGTGVFVNGEFYEAQSFFTGDYTELLGGNKELVKARYDHYLTHIDDFILEAKVRIMQQKKKASDLKEQKLRKEQKQVAEFLKKCS